MAKSSSPTYRDIIQSIRKGNFAPIYLLMGEEAYYLDRIVEELETHVVAEEDKDFNSYTFYGAEAEIERVVATAQQYPVMAERQLVVLKEAQALDQAKRTLEKFEHYFKNPTKTTVLVVVYKKESLAASSAIVKAATASHGVVFNSPRLRDYQMDAPIKEYAAEKRIRMDGRCIGLLVENIGTDLSKLFGEIDKLVLAMPAGESVVTPELIERNIGISKDYNPFELRSAVAVKDYPKAMKIVEMFSRNPRQNPVVMVLASLFNFFSALALAAFAKDQSDSALMSLLNLRSSYFLKEYRAALRCYSQMQILHAITAIRDCDCQAKGIGSQQNEHELLKELVFKIFTQ